MVGGSSQPTCDFTWAIETLSACGSVPPTHSLLGRAVPLTIRCVGLLRSACSDDSVSVHGECVFVRKTECVCSACRSARLQVQCQDHTSCTVFVESHTWKYARMSASGSVIVSDRVRRETMMIPHRPKMDRCCPPCLPSEPSPTPPSHACPCSLALSR